MAYGRITLVLGVQSGLSQIVRFCDGIRRGQKEISEGALPPVKNRLSDAQILSLLSQVIGLERSLRREEIRVRVALLGGYARQEVAELFRVFGVELEHQDMVSIEDIQNDPQDDGLIYVPLDVLHPRQVEHLARLSMVSRRVRHVALTATPKWTHSQLMALRETWEWVDPFVPSRVNLLAEEFIRSNGGITRSDLSKIDLPEGREEVVDPTILTRSPRMKELLSIVDAVADTDSTLLITGESGTGKELIAQRVHVRSHRKRNPLICVNCAAIPSELLESELFGHMKGAFTGAVANREGRFEASEGGTLFLDEIGEMGANLQVKLLRVIQTRRFEPVGSTKSKQANVRIVAATNRDLELEVREGRFREDLFYRLNVIPVHIPALRERREDVAMLVEHFVRKFNREKIRRVTGLSRAALRTLAAYDWPGNVRELENLMERMVILKSSGMIDVLDFPEKYRRKTLSEIEYEDLVQGGRLGGSLSEVVAQGGAGSSGAGAVVGHSVGVSVQMQQVLNTGVSGSGSSYSSGIGFEENKGFSNQESHEEGLGEENFMKIQGTFTRGIIEQSANVESNASAHSNTAFVNSGISSNNNVESNSTISVEGQMSVEQAIRLLQDKMAFPNEGLDFNSVVDQFENILILAALERTGWNRNRAAALLRLNRTTLVEKLKKKQLMPPLRMDAHLLSGHV